MAMASNLMNDEKFDQQKQISNKQIQGNNF